MAEEKSDEARLKNMTGEEEWWRKLVADVGDIKQNIISVRTSVDSLRQEMDDKINAMEQRLRADMDTRLDAIENKACAAAKQVVREEMEAHGDKASQEVSALTGRVTQVEMKIQPNSRLS